MPSLYLNIICALTGITSNSHTLELKCNSAMLSICGEALGFSPAQTPNTEQLFLMVRTTCNELTSATEIGLCADR